MMMLPAAINVMAVVFIGGFIFCGIPRTAVAAAGVNAD
jgi:hypothetical protein